MHRDGGRFLLTQQKDEEGLHIPAGPGVSGTGYKAGQAVAFPMAMHLCHFAAFSSVNGVNRIYKLTGTGGGENLFAVPQKAEGDLGVGDGL